MGRFTCSVQGLIHTIMSHLCATVKKCFAPSAVYGHWVPKEAKNIDVAGKRVLVTGGARGMGLQISLELAKAGAASITMCSRSLESLSDAVTQINDITLKTEALFVQLDLADPVSITKAVAELAVSHDRFDVIIANAATWNPWGSLMNSDGMNSCMAVNHFGHYSFILQLLNKFGKDNLPQRIVIVASVAHALLAMPGIDFDDINLENEDNPRSGMLRRMNLYSQSKLANIYFMLSLADKLRGRVIVHAVHPGGVYTDMTEEFVPESCRNSCMSFSQQMTLKTPRQGAQSSLYAGFSMDAEVASGTGNYFDNCTLQKLSDAAKDIVVREELWAASEAYTGVKLEV